MAYIEDDIWTNPKMQNVNIAGKLLWIYLIKNRHNKSDTGIYKITYDTMRFETGISQIKRTLKSIAENFEIIYDEKNCVIWIKWFFLKYGVDRGYSENQEKGVINHLLQFIRYPIYKNFYDIYSEMINFQLPEPRTNEGLKQDELNFSQDEEFDTKAGINSIVVNVIRYLNKVTGKGFSEKISTKNADIIRARLNEGAKEEDFIKIIDNKSQDPYFQDNPRYMRPSTLFRRCHWEDYLNETTGKKKDKKQSRREEIRKRLEDE